MTEQETSKVKRLVWDNEREDFTSDYRDGKYLKGPIPLPWLSEAAILSGRTLHVALCLWFLSGLQKSKTVKIEKAALDAFGLTRKTVYRGLDKLSEEGLIEVDQRPGKYPIIQILLD